jgi:taurine dioxygenase
VLDVRPSSPALGAEVFGLDLSRPLPERTVREIYAAWLEHQVLVFHDQELSDADQRRVTDYFGEPQDLTRTAPAERKTKPDVMYIGNVTIDGIQGDLPLGEMQFHTDGAYFERPTKATLLFAVHVPSAGGDTLFSNGYKAYASLPETLRQRIECMEALNVYDYAEGGTKRAESPSADAPRFVHPAAIVHPETGRPVLYVNRLMTKEIVGLPAAASEALLEELFAAIERTEFVYAHKWRVGDLVVWDNRCTFHARTEFNPNEKRALRRMTTKGDRPRGVPLGNALA